MPSLRRNARFVAYFFQLFSKYLRATNAEFMRVGREFGGTGVRGVDLYELIRRRYERAATIITSNRDISEWYAMFGDDLLASSAMDRLLHHSNVIVMDGHSYRNPPKNKAA